MSALKTIWGFLWNHKTLVLVTIILLLILQVLRLSYRNSFLSAKIVRQDNRFTTWVDSMGREHGRQKVQAVYITQLTEGTKALLDSVAHVEKIKPDHINHYTQVKTETRGTFKATVDTAGDFSFADNNLKIQGKVEDSSGHKLVEENYMYSDVGNFVVYDSSKKFLGIKYRTDKYADVYFDNKNTHITGLTNISLKAYNPPKHFGVGPTVGYAYVTGQWHPFVGIGLTYTIIKW